MRLIHPIRIFVSLAFCVAWLAVTAPSSAASDNKSPTCAVVVEGAPGADAASLAALVEAAISQRGHVQLVERQLIDRVIAEQTLAASGVVDADRVVIAGRLMSADLLAVIDSGADNSAHSLGVVVFDTSTGVRLWDAAVDGSGEISAGAIADAVDAAGNKRKAGLSRAGLKTVCLETVRNADLPRDADGICRAAGVILMRRLASAAEVAVIERARLHRVTEERRLTGVENELIASTVCIEIQVSRASRNGEDGVDVAAVLVDGSGARRNISAARVDRRRPDEIAQAILEPLASSLQITPPVAPTGAQRLAESKRFLHEAMLRWSYADVADALDASEAAFALNPTDRHAAAARARALVVCGTAIVCHGGFADPARQNDIWVASGDPHDTSRPRIPPENLTLSLQYAQRGAEALMEIGYRPQVMRASDFAVLSRWSNLLDEEPLVGTTEELLRLYLGQMRWEMIERNREATGISPLRLDDTQAAIFRSIQDDFRHQRLVVEEPIARSWVKDQRSFNQYTRFLGTLLCDAQCIWPADGREWTQEWETLISAWVPLERAYGKFSPATAVASPTRRGIRELDFWSARRLAKPFAILSAVYPVTQSELPAPLRMARSRNATVNWAGSYFSYKWRMTDPDWNRLFAAIDNAEGLQSDGMKSTSVPVAAMAGRNPASDGVDNAARPPARRILAPHKLLPSPTTAASEVGPGTAWPDSRVLIDFDDRGNTGLGSDAGAVAFPRVDDLNHSAYAIVLPNQHADTPRLNLVKFDLGDGRNQIVSSFIPADAKRDPLPVVSSSAVNGSSAALMGGYYIYSDPETGIYLFPLNGGNARVINRSTADLPSDFYHAAAVLNDVLYLAVGAPGREGYLLSYGLKDGVLRTLASGRRFANASTQPSAEREAQAATTSPFDNAAPLFVWHMLADDGRKHIVFLVSNTTWKRGLAGWWSYEPATGAFHQLLAAEIRTEPGLSWERVWNTPAFAGQLAFGGTNFGPSLFDLRADIFTRLPPVPAVFEYTGPELRPTGDRSALSPPFAQKGGWTWGRFGRYQRTDSVLNGRQTSTVELQSFDPLRKQNMRWGSWPDFIEPIDADRAIVGDSHRLWLLHVPTGDPIAMGKLVQPSRPVSAQFEPVGPPPHGGDLPWQHVTTVYDVLRNVNAGNGKSRYMRGPQIVGDNVFVLACGDGPFGEQTARLTKFALATRQRTELGTADAPGFGNQAPSRAAQASMSIQLGGFAIDDQFYYAGIPHNGVICFPLNGAKPKTIDFKPGPLTPVTDVAAVGGKLFVAADVYQGATEAGKSHVSKLFRVDVASEFREELAVRDIESEASQTPLSDLKFRLLRADAKRQRMVFIADGRRRGDRPTNELWACGVADAPRRICTLEVPASDGEQPDDTDFNWAGRVRGDQWLVSSPAGAIRIDLATLAVQRLWQVQPTGDSAIVGQYNLRPPMALWNGWLLDGLFRRVRLDGSAFDQMPAMRPMATDQPDFQLQFLESSDDGSNLVLADNCGLWIAAMKPSSSISSP